MKAKVFQVSAIVLLVVGLTQPVVVAAATSFFKGEASSQMGGGNGSSFEVNAIDQSATDGTGEVVAQSNVAFLPTVTRRQAQVADVEVLPVLDAQPTTIPTEVAAEVPSDVTEPTAVPTEVLLQSPTDAPQPASTPVPTFVAASSSASESAEDPTGSDEVSPASTPQPTLEPEQTESPVIINEPTLEPVSPTQEPMMIPTLSPDDAAFRAMRVEYDDYSKSRQEESIWNQKMTDAGINLVVLSAGRTEWAYFKWEGHKSDWSSEVRDGNIDILAEDSALYGQLGQVNAVIDVYSPNYIAAHPEKAAVNVLGQRSPNLVSTAELVNGEFGKKLLDMVEYIAANYPNVDSISITELSYRIDGYGDDDLALYKAATGRSDWPRQSNGQVKIDDPSIGNWRSAVMGEFLGRATARAHKYGKQLYMDVSVSVNNLSLMTNNRGTNYETMLQNVDKIVVWDYFGEDGFPPEYSRDIAEFLTQFGTDRVILSVGLWGESGATVSAKDFKTAIQATQNGGMPNVWICPGSMMTADHWQVLYDLWGIG